MSRLGSVAFTNFYKKMALILLNNFSWELLNATEPLAIRQKTEYISAELIDQAAANGIYKLVPLD